MQRSIFGSAADFTEAAIHRAKITQSQTPRQSILGVWLAQWEAAIISKLSANFRSQLVELNRLETLGTILGHQPQLCFQHPNSRLRHSPTDHRQHLRLNLQFV